MKKKLFIGALAALMLSCASGTQSDIEKARFLLDEGEFQQAIDLMDPIVAADSSNNEAKFILGSALIGNFALEPKSGCQAEDTGYLGVLACLLDDKESGDTNGLQTFARIAPEDSGSNDDINRAVEILVSIDEFSENVPEVDVALQRLVARSFDISVTFQIAGANSPNVNQCYTGGTGQDEIPDDYDSSNIDRLEAQSFRDNLEAIEVDAKLVGFGDDFNLISRANNILADIDANTSLSNTASVRLVFDNSYINKPGQQDCN